MLADFSVLIRFSTCGYRPELGQCPHLPDKSANVPADCASTVDVWPANEQYKSKTDFHSVLLPSKSSKGRRMPRKQVPRPRGFLVGDRNTHNLAGARGEAEAEIGDV